MKVDPIGFGPVGRNWMPRVQYAGTYDEQWMQERMPLLPDDFDDRFHQAAASDMILPSFVAPGEWVDVAGCTMSGRVFFQLPEILPFAQVNVANAVHDVAMQCNTVSVDTDRMRLTLLFKGMLRIHRDVPTLRRTTISAAGITL